MYKLIIYQACTVMEAIHEINIMLKNVGLSISEDNLVSSEIAEDVPDDWFEDYIFTFKVDFSENLLDKSGVDWDYEEE